MRSGPRPAAADVDNEGDDPNENTREFEQKLPLLKFVWLEVPWWI